MTLGFWKPNKTRIIDSILHKEMVHQEKHTEETAFCPPTCKVRKNKNIWVVTTTDLMTNFPFQL